jgi:hypothetical protein
MGNSNMFQSLLEMGLYMLWLIPVFGVYVYFRFFLDRYAIGLHNAQHHFRQRMADETDTRRTRANMKQMAKDHGDENDGDDEVDEYVNLRDMDPAERIIFCLEKGLILNLNIPISDAKTGQVVGLDTVNANGDILLSRGSYVTSAIIKQLKKVGVEEISVMMNPEHPMAVRALS